MNLWMLAPDERTALVGCLVALTTSMFLMTISYYLNKNHKRHVNHEKTARTIQARSYTLHDKAA